MSPNPVSESDLQSTCAAGKAIFLHLCDLRDLAECNPETFLDVRYSYIKSITAMTTLDRSFRLRSYQAEMVEESLKANVIVVMDTGSGKTHM